MSKPKLRFYELNAAELTQFAEQVLGKMSQETDLFDSPQPSLAELEDALTAFREATTEAAFGDRRAIVLRNQRKAELEGVIYELSKYVDTVAAGDEAMVLAAGFIPQRTGNNTRFGRAPKPSGLRAQPDYVGSARIEIRVDRWAGARMYQFEYRKKGFDEEWNQVLSSKSTCLLEGLDVFEEYEFRVSYRGVDSAVVYSDVVSSYVI